MVRAGETSTSFKRWIDAQTEATLKAMGLLLETPQVLAAAPLRLYVRSSNAVYALEGHIHLPTSLQGLLARVHQLCQRCPCEVYAVRSLRRWIPLAAWVVALPKATSGLAWAVLEPGLQIVWSAEPEGARAAPTLRAPRAHQANWVEWIPGEANDQAQETQGPAGGRAVSLGAGDLLCAPERRRTPGAAGRRGGGTG